LAAPKNPKGAKSDKEWRAAIQRAVKRTMEDGKTKRLEGLADAVVAAGLAGDVSAIKEIGDRLDGKPHQTQDTNVTMGAGEAFIEMLRLVANGRGAPTGEVADRVAGEQGQRAQVRH
jgi:hypothetical protein